MEWKESRFYVVIEGRPSGPFTFDELRTQKLKGTDFVRSEGMKEFKELREIEGLSTLLAVRHERSLPQYFATLDVRLLAWGIDMFICFFIYALLAIVFLAGSESGSERISVLLIGLLSVPVLKFFLNSIMEGGVRQASPGKLLIGVRVTDAAGAPIGVGRAFLRNFAKILGVLTLGIGFFSGFFDKKQQCLHDKIAGTMVIKSRLI